MSIFVGGVKADAVYVGGGAGSSTMNTVQCIGANGGSFTGTMQVTPPAHVGGDLILVAVSAKGASPPSPPDATWTVIDQKVTDFGLIAGNYSTSTFYKFAPAGGMGTFPISGANHVVAALRGIHASAPIGAHAVASQTGIAKGIAAPAITMTNTTGNAGVMSLVMVNGLASLWTPPANYTALMAGNEQDYAVGRNDRTTAAVPQILVPNADDVTGFGHTIEFLPGISTNETGLAMAVYLGTVKVWPDFVPAETIYSTAGNHTYTIPPEATKLDIVMVSGGVAGTNGSIGGNGRGGNAGLWASRTLVRGTDIPMGTTTISVVVGAGGAGNGAAGNPSSASATGMITLSAAGGSGVQGITNPTGQSPGDHTFNGRVYVGGAQQTALNNPGNAPGGGSAGGGFASNAGAGAPGRVWIYAYQ